MERAVDDRRRADRRRQREAAADVALAPAEHGGVDGEHERLVAGGGGAVDHLLDEAAVAPGVHLEPQPAVADRPHLLDRAGAERRQRVGQPGPRGGAGDGELALGIGDAGEPGRREHQRVGERLAEQRRARCRPSRRRAAPGAGSVVAANAACVGGQRALVLGAAVDVVEHAAGQPALGDAAEIGDRRGPGEAPLDAVGLDATEADHRAQGLVRVHGRLPTTP